VIFLLLLLVGCNGKKETAKLFLHYTSQGIVEIISPNEVSKYSFVERRYDNVCELEIQKDKTKIKIVKKDNIITIDQERFKSVSEDIFLEYYINKLINAEKYSIVKEGNDTLITLDLKGDIRYLHYYFTNSKLRKIDVIYQDERFKKAIILTRYEKL